MRNIAKEFVEVLKCNIYGNEWEWVIVDKPYEEMIEELKKPGLRFVDEVRLVEKNFNPENFKVAEKVLKKARRIEYLEGKGWEVKEF